MLDGGDELENRLGLVGEGAVGVEGGEWFVRGRALVLGEWAWVDRRHARGGGLAEECEGHVELRGDLAHLG